MTDDIYIYPVENDDWAGFVNDRQVTKPACKKCILKLLLKMTAKSTRYKKIIIINPDGTETAYPTGVADAGSD